MLDLACSIGQILGRSRGFALIFPDEQAAAQTEQLIELAQQAIQAARFPDLATIDGDQPRVRPVSPVKTDGFTVYVANLRSYHKTSEIAANPRVELCYLDAGHNKGGSPASPRCYPIAASSKPSGRPTRYCGNTSVRSTTRS